MKYFKKLRMLYRRMVSDSLTMDYSLKAGDTVTYSGAWPRNALFIVHDLTWSYDCAALRRIDNGSIVVAPTACLTKVD